MNGPDLRLGNLIIPERGRVRVTQSYRELRSGEDQRTAGGTGIRWTQWDGKLATDLTLNGWQAPGFAGVDLAAALVVSCYAPRAIDSASRVIDIPAARRAGGVYAPVGLAEVAIGGRLSVVQTSLVLVGDQATLGEVAHAHQYRVQYWPEFTAHVTLISESLNTSNPDLYTVQLSAEQV